MADRFFVTLADDRGMPLPEQEKVDVTEQVEKALADRDRHGPRERGALIRTVGRRIDEALG